MAAGGGAASVRTIPWLRVKTSARGGSTTPARAALPAGIDEAVFLNERGEVCEGTITNVFRRPWAAGCVTPPLGCGLLPGVLRGELLARGACREAVLRRGRTCGGGGSSSAIRCAG